MTTRMMLQGVLIAAWVASASAATPPDSLHPSPKPVLIVSPVDAGVWTIIDGRTAGRGALLIDSLSPGRHVIRCLGGSLASWDAPALTDTVEMLPGDTIRISYPPAGTWLLTSVPSGAAVLLGDSLLGTTPILLPQELRKSFGAITLRKDGFNRELLSAGEETWANVQIFLRPEGGNGVSPYELASSRFSRAGVLLTGSGALLAGAAAAWCKIKADGKSELFALSGSPALRGEIDRLDRWGGLSLFLCEGLVAYLTYLLLAE